MSIFNLPGPQISDQQLIQAELELSMSFPSEYRLFMLNFNGAVEYDAEDNSCRDLFYRIKADSDAIDLPGIGIIGECKTTDAINLVAANKRLASKLPTRMLAIYPMGENQICINCQPGDDFGRIYEYKCCEAVRVDVFKNIDPPQIIAQDCSFLDHYKSNHGELGPGRGIV